MLTADAQYAANLAHLATQPAMLPLVAQMAQLPLTNLLPGQSPTGHQIAAAYDVTTQAWVPLCDLQDPVGAAEQAVSQVWNRETTVYTMLGIGMGYAITAFAKRLLPYQRLVVWDPEAAFFKAMLYAVDVQEIFTGKRIEIYTGNDVMQHIEPWYMGLEVHEKLHIAFPINHSYTGVGLPPPHPAIRRTDYQAVLDKCMEMLRFHMVGLATWRMFGRHIGDNDLENLPEYYANPGLNALRGLWQGKPAVCVAAGPSLQHNLRQLLPAEVRSKVALLTVGTTYGLLQGLGLQPDIVTTIDFQRLNWTDQFQHLPLDPDCALVYLHSTYPQTVRRWPGPCFVAENSSDTMSWIKQWALDDKGAAGMVQTVAHLNLLVALALGANPIILLGQDLSMPAMAHHTAGARAQDQAPAEVPPEAFMDVVDMHGQPVKTRHSFASMLLVFQRIVAEHPETTFINASEQGLAIQGMQHLPLAQVLAQLPPLTAAPVTRPVFQGETPTMLATRHAPSLRQALKTVAARYVPQVKDEFPAQFHKLCQEVEDIAGWAQQTQATWECTAGLVASPDQLQAACSSDVFSDDETHEMVARWPLYQQIMASEQTLQDRPHATGMYVIRRFDFIELKGEIPPPADQIAEPWQHARLSAERLARAARMFAEEVPTLRLLLRRARRRLQPSPQVTQALARQQYRHALRLLHQISGQPGTLPPVAHLRTLVQCLRHTQQYALALALMDAWDHFATAQTAGTVHHAARIRQHLARYHADVRHALAAYFPQVVPAPVLPLGDVTHAWAQAASGGVCTPVLPLVSSLNAIPFGTNGHSPVLPVHDAAGYLWHG